MRISPARLLLALACLALLLCGVRTESAWAAKKKPAKSWPSKKKHPHHKKSTPASGGGAAKSSAPGAAPAEDADEEGGDDSAEGDEASNDDAKAESPRAKKVAREEGEGDDGDGDDSTVVRKKARKSDDDDDESSEGAPVAVELWAGPRAVHRTFDFNDPLASHQQGATNPYAYQLPAGPAPFIQVGLYPAAFATRGFAANIGLVGSFEKLVATKTGGGTQDSTFGQQFEVGLRGRLPLGAGELGLTGAYGKHSFRLAAVDPGPATSTLVPNVDYTFVRVGVDGRVAISAVELGLHVGTRLVSDTGSLGKVWFPSTKTKSIEAGFSLAYRITPLVGVVGGVDFLRYAFDFNPVPTSNPARAVAGGAVDQYISGFLALRLTIAGG